MVIMLHPPLLEVVVFGPAAGRGRSCTPPADCAEPATYSAPAASPAPSQRQKKKKKKSLFIKYLLHCCCLDAFTCSAIVVNNLFVYSTPSI